MNTEVVNQKNTSLAIVIPTLRGAGCERIVVELIPELNKCFNLHLILYHHAISYPIPKDLKIELLHCNTSVNHSYFYKFYRYIKKIVALSSLIRKNRYDIILSFIDLNNVVVYFANKLSGREVKLIVSERTVNESFFRHNRYAHRLKKLIKFLLKYVYNRSNKVITNSKAMKYYLKKEMNVKSAIDVIYNGINIDKFYPIKNGQKLIDESMDRKYTKENITRLLHVGRLDDNKDQAYLIRIFPMIYKSIPNAQLFIIGIGPNKEKLIKLISKMKLETKIHILGWKDNVEDYMRCADIFLLSSYHESFGNVIAESMACGVPVVTTCSTDALYEILDNGRLGTIVNKYEEEEYIKAVINTLNKHCNDRYFKKEISNYAMTNFNREIMHENYINIIKSV